MGDLYSRIVNKMWPRERYPLLRLPVYLIYRNLPNFFSVTDFLLWRLYSRRRFGMTRWIKLDWGRLCVRSDDYRARWVARTSGTQKEIIKTWINLARLKPNLCIDAGANYGEFTAAIAGFGIPSVAIEANPTIVDCLKSSFADFSNVSIVHAAVSDTDGSMSFHFNPQYSGSASLSKKSSTTKIFLGQKGQIHSTEVKSVRLDSLVLNELKMRPKSLILKIDVETFELKVFTGVLTLLSRCDWWRVIAEFSPSAIRKANGNVEEVWKTYRNFPGLVIGREPVSEEKCRVLTSDLPESPPLFSCDVLIGQGSVNPFPNS